MLLRCLSLLSGAYALGLSRALPADELYLPLVLLAAACVRPRKTRLLACFLAGYAAMWLAAWLVIDDRLEPALQGQTLDIAVRVADFPSETDATLRFVAEPVARPDLPAHIRLSWYESESVPRIGEVWQLRVRLRRPRGYANPGGFDYESWLFRERLGATGYVVAHPGNRLLATIPAASLSQFRQAFVDRVTALLPMDDASAVLLAVSVGARHRITREQWDRYATTGTIHLMAISGLHIGLAAGSVFLLAWGILAPFCRRANVRDMALTVAVMAAASYAAVSGFALPAQRAFLMAMLATAAVIYRYRLDAATLVAIPCIALFVFDPVAIHAPGFKLSFAAVAIIFWSLQWHRVSPPVHGSVLLQKLLGYLQGLGLLQIVLLAGLFPLTTLIFGRFSMIAPLMNLLILPLFNFLTVPFCLAGMLLHGPLQALGDQLLRVAYESVRLVLSLVSFAADLRFVRAGVLAQQGPAVLLLLLPALYILFPAGWPGRKLAWLAIVAALLYRPPGPPRGCLDYHVLDVGQGLAVVLRTHGHTVLFDTGPAFRSGSNTAELVIMPFLRSRAIERLDTLILSHADQDHAGGAGSILGEFAIGRTFAGEPVALPGPAQSACDTTVTWSVEMVQFRFLHPSPGRAWVGNNASCVLEVALGDHVLLLTGDIEAPVEAALLEQGRIGRVDTVIVPHHGSRTSSSPGFVMRLGADLAIVSAGFGNRWGFPKPTVVKRWQDSGATLLQTATAGAIGQRICLDSGVTAPSSARRDARKYWHE
jgi:competence protein ComEC